MPPPKRSRHSFISSITQQIRVHFIVPYILVINHGFMTKISFKFILSRCFRYFTETVNFVIKEIYTSTNSNSWLILTGGSYYAGPTRIGNLTHTNCFADVCRSFFFLLMPPALRRLCGHLISITFMVAT